MLEFQVQLNMMIRLRIWLVSFIYRILEKYLFDPKIRDVLVGAFLKIGVEINSPKKELILFDIGANRGQSIHSLKKIVPASLIYSFEPDPIVFQQLVTKNSWSGVKFFNIAVGERSGRFPFYISPLSETSTLVIPNLASKWNKKKASILGMNIQEMYAETEVDVTTIDDFMLSQEINHIDLIKIDVEGGELQVLLGARNAFQRKMISIVQFEIHNNDLRASQKKQIETFLFEQDFRYHSSVKHNFGNFSDVVYVKQS
jgi:FkbM family methyltransferase